VHDGCDGVLGKLKRTLVRVASRVSVTYNDKDIKVLQTQRRRGVPRTGSDESGRLRPAVQGVDPNPKTGVPSI
jgi:hypothetical protein